MMSNEKQLEPSSSKSKIFKCTEHADNISKRLQSFYEKKEFFDIVLIAGVDNVKVQAHRIVLCASSDYFLAMFRSNLQEAKADEVELKEIDGSTMEMIIDFMYTASIELRCETVESVLTAAHFLQMNRLVAACCDFMGEQLDASNCLGIALFAEQHNYDLLHKKASSFAFTRFDKVWSEKEFVQLNEEQLNKFLSSDDLGKHSEEIVFRSLVAWVEHDKENREKLIFNLLSHIRFTLLEPKFIIENRHSVCKTIECYELVFSWLQWHFSPESRSQFPKELTEARKANCKLCFVSGYDTNNLKVQTFNRGANTWSFEELPVPSKNRSEHSMIVINGKIIIAGGMIDKIETNSVECLDLQTKEWTDLPPMGLARIYPGIAELNGDLYVVGGLTGGIWGCSAEKYDFSTREWHNIAPTISSLKPIQLAFCDGFLYAAGNMSRVIECYEPGANKWTQWAIKDERIANVGLAAVGEHLYFVGGSNGVILSNTVKCYHPSTDTWKIVSSLKIARSLIKCVASNNRLIECGGCDGNSWSNLVEEYDPETNEWNTLAPLLSNVGRSESDNIFTM